MESSLPEQLFLDLRISDVLDKTVRLPRAKPWAFQYCTAISEKRYGDAIYARYHMDGQAKDGVHTDLRDTGDGKIVSHETPVYDMIMEDARSYAHSVLTSIVMLCVSTAKQVQVTLDGISLRDSSR